ncbi:MAG TPA: hypothetical protein VFM88_06415 [Vicinamibacteria bacterium]|nr:hypothetical protein [Vicinamibacteria bacterium]
MEQKREGVAFPPVPLPGGFPRESAGRSARFAHDAEPRCEMCGATVIASHCKRICLRCGFMTGCSEGI